ncbi:bifunctional tRNA (5-methylaminomethyl-2-thiouridine)(34)-methyltransferase MnmD/FAD-dependent 5-carboxymethylaminomethyl-2-thiouridine(34) oxidoreductase MnmC [Thauera mechernichensis]|uniref:tRNA 5-methylaminomethyl-2-thiouridine biosynthesis bifunctional protein MnmC n=1 Tax=Thauera mechernichensis TaxID=82788 RepID=A0ABW3WD30_9RHOO|nr:bifunctional tRNA (5-methylaminomethyl-2-thiouridine)(34)-methyltransferase MnmD/FAD-dependent 5-carboxymethylaminomethyl-2-thiouridine(34) oxidoreductase MnmC [Thauera mechernichensis]MDG3064936.1 bifunctional tRNA (5-methylaminomethyl-2-thiouridine)(34)-methyltransferase MnmD/FAD-dependent 5-carboxymethylaminomethyl-2-thiouridine(34) oxidoreductase MnmC [Thauera mechernichensis]
MPIIPARLEHSADGVPYSSTFDDIYHSADGALGQAQHVFLAGNALPERWQGREHFVIVETGFGLGLNFLATWAAWRADPQRCKRLHFISCELHPFSTEDLARVHARWPQLAAQADALRAQWPALTPGLHRLHLDNDQVTLTLYFGDAREGLAQLLARADAFYLDGFSPARNPELWSARIFHLLARLAAPGATLATWSVAGEVREGLRRAGFEVRKAAGFGGKRQMLCGILANSETHSQTDEQALPARGHALIVGAGLAGCSMAERLAARGWTIELIDQAAGPANGASGNLAGVLRPLPSLDDNRMSRLTRAGTLHGWAHIARLRARGLAVQADACGVLHLARDGAQAAKMQAVVERLGLPASHLSHVDTDAAARIAGCTVAAGGWWFADSGWVQPPSLCAANLAASGQSLHTHFGRKLAQLERQGGLWHAYDDQHRLIAAAPVVILAAGVGVLELDTGMRLPVVSARGQVSLLPAASASPPRVVVCRGGYVSPEIDGLRCAGATFDVDDSEPALRARDHADNLGKLEAMLPGFTHGLDATALRGRVGFRPASPDRLPMIGALPADGTAAPRAELAGLARQAGLHVLSGYGARGLVWTTLAAESLASALCAEPLPLERDLWEALDPGRFLLRPPRPGRTAE